jgi:hypothetical protein
MTRYTGKIMITFPPLTSHKLQSLDQIVFGSFRLHYNRAVSDLMSSNPGKTISYDVAQMVGRVFPLVFKNSSSTLSGFTASGIYPLNQDTFSVIACVRQISANRSCSKRAFYFKTASSFTVTP